MFLYKCNRSRTKAGQDNMSIKVQQKQDKNRTGQCFYKSATRAEQKQDRTMFL
jgi:hypothetical protein